MTDKKNMVGVGRFADSSYQRKGQRKADRFIIVLPHDLVKSTEFPFEDMEQVVVKLENRRLIITKIGE